MSEFRVNTTTAAAPDHPSVAIDADGDFVVVWNSGDGSGRGVFGQRFNAAGVAQGDEFRINTDTLFDQYRHHVAMDADGDFVVVWASDGPWGIYGQRYNAAGEAQGDEFRINTSTRTYSSSPSVSMDADGDFVVVWQSDASDGSGYGLYGQRYNAAGVAQGAEFRVNTTGIPSDRDADVAMDANGNFVVVWAASYGGSPVSDSGSLYGRLYNAAGVAQGGQFLINPVNNGSAHNIEVAMDADGDFVATWQSWSADWDDIYAQRFNAAGEAQDAEFRVNADPFRRQLQPAISMDADGNFAIVWSNIIQDTDVRDVYGRAFNAAGEAISDQFRLNTTTEDHQYGAVVAVDADGDTVTAWVSQNQDGSSYGIYAQRYANTLFDDVTPPTITSITSNDAMLTVGQTATFTITFSERVTGFALDDLTATNGTLSGFVAVDPRTYTVVFTPTAELLGTGGISIAPASYTNLGGNDGPAGSFLTQAINTVAVVGSQFQVNTQTEEPQSYPAVAIDQDGDFVVVWAGYDADSYGIFGQRYDAAGVAQGGEFQVNTTSDSGQYYPSVAMDADGDFVVVWASYYQDGEGYGIFAQRYNAAGVTQGDEFQVNTTTAFYQTVPSVAMDADGDFVVVWQSEYQDGLEYAVYGQRYNAAGVAQGVEFKVGTATAGAELLPRVAMDADGDFVVVWSHYIDAVYSDDEEIISPGEYSIYARRYNAAGVAQGDEILVTSTNVDSENPVSVAMDTDGDFVVVWTAWDGDTDDIYARRYDATGIAQGAEFRVNTTTDDNQYYFSVSMDASGDFVVVWESEYSDPNGIYGQRYDATGLAVGPEFQINVDVVEDASYPSVAVDADGDFVVAWVSDDNDGNDIFARRFDLTAPTVISVTSDDPLLAAGQTATFTITFDEGVTGFQLNDLVATNGTLDNFASLSASQYTVVFTPTANFSGTGGIAFAANSYTDLAGNNGPAGSLLTQQIDTVVAVVVSGGVGDDVLYGNPGGDSMIGGAGNDQYVINNADDSVTEAGGDGVDTAWVEIDDWTMPANLEILRLYGAGTRANGSTGNDVMVANQGAASSLAGGGGDDEIWGGPFANTLSGGEGDDIIRGQDGPAVMIGGVGNDQFVVGHVGVSIIELPGEGTDIAWVSVDDWTLPANVEILRLIGAATRVTGSSGNDSIVTNATAASSLLGGDGHDELWGNGFASTLDGGAGDDTIRGQDGPAVMIGGAGHDQFLVGHVGTTISELASEGTDTAYVAVNDWTNFANVEIVRLSGTGVVRVTGQSGAEELVANQAEASRIDGAGGADTIWGSAGADTLIGGGGNDVLYSQGGADRFVYDTPDWGYDQISGFTAGQAKIQFGAGSGVTQFSQLFLNMANGNTQVEFNGHAILVFGVASMTASDFIFG